MKAISKGRLDFFYLMINIRTLLTFFLFFVGMDLSAHPMKVVLKVKVGSWVFFNV